MEVKWHDDFNIPYAGELRLSPASGVGHNMIGVSSDPNEYLDRHCSFVASSTNYVVTKKEFVVGQEGKRQAVRTKDGLVVGLQGKGTMNVLKTK